MGTKSVIAIDVQDGSFKKFLDLFNAYTEKLEDLPDNWRKLDEAMSSSGASFGKATANVSDLLAIAATQTAAIVEAIEFASKAQSGFRKQTDQSTSAVARLGKQVEGVAKGAEAGAKWLLKAASIGGALGGIGGGLGVFELASSVLTNQRQASGLGLSVGQMRSWNANMSPFVGSNILQGAAGAQLDPSKFGALAALGISGQQAQGENATALAIQISNAARRAYQQNPNVNTAQAQSFFALGGTMADWRNLGSANGAQLAGYESKVGSDASGLGYTSKTAAAWQQLSVQLDKAGYKIQSSLIDGLEPLAPTLTKLSGALSDGISAFLRAPQVKQDLQDFTNWLESPAFMGEMKDIGSWLKVAGQDILSFAASVGSAAAWFTAHFPHAATAGSAGTPGSALATGHDELGKLGQGPLQNLINRGAAAAYRDLGWYTPQTIHAANLAAERKYHLPTGTLDKIAFAESSYGKKLFSPAGAVGPYQLMPGTAEALHVNPLLTDQAAMGAGNLLSQLYKKYGNWDQAYAAYNWNPAGLDADIKAHGKNWLAFAPKETQNYVASLDSSTLAQQVAAVVHRGQAAPAAARGPGSAHNGGLTPYVTNLLKKLATQTAQKQQVSLNITNNTSARVAMSLNAAAVG